MPDEMTVEGLLEIREAHRMARFLGCTEAEALLHATASKYAVYHIDGDRANNDLANLRLVRVRENRR